MGEREGGGGFGFAPPGDPAVKRLDHRPAAPRKDPPKPPPPAARAPARPEAQARPLPPVQSPSTPLWVWLVIGVLLGTGGTLLTSSFWLPERESADLAAMEPEEIERASGDLATPAAAAEPAQRSTPNATPAAPVAVTEAEAEAPAPAADAGEPEAEPTIAALDTPDAAIQPEIDDESGPGPARPARASSAEVVGETLLSAASSDAIGLQPQTPAAATSAARDEAQAALDALRSDTETGGSSAISAVEAAASNRSPASNPASASEAGPGNGSERPVVAAMEPATRQARAEAEGGEPAPRAAAEPSTDRGDFAQLPERIRRALEAGNSVVPNPAGGGADDEPLYRVQLAAVRDEAAAQVYWREVNERLPGVFSDVQPVYDERVVDERLYLRIWVGAFDNRGDAFGYCSWLKEQGQDCFVTRVDNL